MRSDDHLRFLSSSQVRAIVAAINITITLHGLDEAGFSLRVGESFVSADGFGGGRTKDGEIGVGTASCISD